MVDRQFEPRRQAIIDTVSGGEPKESKPIEGGFEAIPVPTTGIQEYNFVTQRLLTIYKLRIERIKIRMHF